MAITNLIPAVRAQQAADEVRVLESTPAANAHIGRKSSAFFVRFDRLVDHRKSALVNRTVCTNQARGWISIDPARLYFLSLLQGTLVDLYLVTADAGERARLRQETEAT